MKFNINIFFKIFILANIIGFSACSKYLDDKPDKNITTINTIDDLQSILDNPIAYNKALLTASADEYYLTKTTFDSKSQLEREIYTWEPYTNYLDPWSINYLFIYRANAVLSEIERFKSSPKYNYIKGQALFLRAFSYYFLSQLYCNPYTENASNDLGLPLRNKPDVEAVYPRSTLEGTYEMILSDLNDALVLLDGSDTTINRGNKLSCLGLFARIYLSMRDYEKASEYATLYLKDKDDILDYNSISENINPSFPVENIETVYYDASVDGFPYSSFVVDSNLYNCYEIDDLRKTIFYYKSGSGEIKFKGSYHGRDGFMTFYGITTSEITLIRSECAARVGKLDIALVELNKLLEKRYRKGTFHPLEYSDQNQLISAVLLERRKELAFRGTRWSDLRRYNIEGKNITLIRQVGTEYFTLPPGDPRWVWLIPAEVMSSNKWEQNKR